MSKLPPEDHIKLVGQLIRHEGAKRDRKGLHIAYQCPAGAWTIGYGHNLDANPVPGITLESRLNEDQARRLLMADIAEVEERMNRHAIFRELADNIGPARYAVLINMAFNLGVIGLLGFAPTLNLIKQGAYTRAAARMLRSLWATQVFDRAKELSRQMESGTWA